MTKARCPNIPSFESLPLKNKRVLVRVDFNVPFKDGKILDISRLEAVLPTLRALLDKGACVILLSHLGRPQGKTDPLLSLAPLVRPLSTLLKQEVAFCPETLGPQALQAIQGLQPGHVVLLENVRFHAEEERNDTAFAKALASLGDLYINEAFSVSHRAHASVEGITHFLPSYGGLALAQEVNTLNTLFSEKAHPVMALIGGGKVSTKIGLLSTLVEKVDCLALGGGLAIPFLKSDTVALSILEKANTVGCQIILPSDGVVAPSHIKLISDLEDTDSIFDLGPLSVEAIINAARTMKTFLWNGPVGVFEKPPFDQGSCALAKGIAHLTKKSNLQSIAGGGETLALLKQAGVADAFSYVSTAGGAFLEYIEGLALPGIDALVHAKDKEQTSQG